MIYTCWCNYSATGEGVSIMALLTSVHVDDQTHIKELLTKRFTEVFGEYMTIGMEYKKGVHSDFPNSGYVLSNGIVNTFKKWESDNTVPYTEYHATFHYNYS